MLSITYYLNPKQVSDQSRVYPQYEFINPLGLTIIHYRVDQAYSVQPTVAAPSAPPSADKLQQVLQGKQK